MNRALHIHRVGTKFRAENVGEPRQLPRPARQRRRPGHRQAVLAGERERDARPAHGETAYHLTHRFGLGAVGLQEFQPRRRRVKEIMHLDARALRQRRRLQLALVAGIDGKRPAVRLTRMPRGDGEPRHRADRRQRLAAKPERIDGEQIVAVELRGGVALHRQSEVVARHAGAVVGHADQPPAAGLGRHLDAPRAGVERVLHQFLDGAGGTLDHLAGGDAVDDGFGELADGHERT